jgi:hypothetical protein
LHHRYGLSKEKAPETQRKWDRNVKESLHYAARVQIDGCADSDMLHYSVKIIRGCWSTN